MPFRSPELSAGLWGLYARIRPEPARLPDGVAAAQSTAHGKFVVGVPKGWEQAQPDPYGHLVAMPHTAYRLRRTLSAPSIIPRQKPAQLGDQVLRVVALH